MKKHVKRMKTDMRKMKKRKDINQEHNTRSDEEIS